MRWLQPKIGRVIAISSFLQRYDLSRGCSVLRVPPLIDMDEAAGNQYDPVLPEDNLLRLVYAGMPAKKDLLGNALRALRDLRASGSPVMLDLVGPSRQSLSTCLDGDTRLLDELGSAIVCHGRVPRKVAMGVVAKADFSILLRPDRRYAHAGFPTKLVESFSLGVPILTNLTGDIADYVRDGQEGVLLEDSSPQAFIAGVRKVLDTPRELWTAMRPRARQRARNCFDYRQHVQPLRGFIEESIAKDFAGRQQGTKR